MKFTIEIPDELMDGIDYAISKEVKEDVEPMTRQEYVEFVMVKACENYMAQKEKGI